MSLDDWLEANQVETLPDDDKIFKFESSEQEEVRAAKPWERDPNFFKSAKISAAALLKMAVHAKSGGNIEVSDVLNPIRALLLKLVEVVYLVRYL